MLESGEDGYVTDVKWRNTTICSLRSTRVYIVPNSKVASSIITNYNLPRKMMWYRVYVGVAYDSDLEQVELLLRTIEHGVKNLQAVSDYFRTGRETPSE